MGGTSSCRNISRQQSRYPHLYYTKNNFDATNRPTFQSSSIFRCLSTLMISFAARKSESQLGIHSSDSSDGPMSRRNSSAKKNSTRKKPSSWWYMHTPICWSQTFGRQLECFSTRRDRSILVAAYTLICPTVSFFIPYIGVRWTYLFSRLGRLKRWKSATAFVQSL